MPRTIHFKLQGLTIIRILMDAARRIHKRCKSFATFTAKPLHKNKVKEP